MSDAITLWTDPADPHITIREKSGNHHRLGVFLDDLLLSVMVTEPFYKAPTVAKISETHVREGYRRKGFMRLLVSYYRNNFGPLCSDEGQTEEAREMWKALIQQPGGLKIMVWDVDAGTKTAAKGVPAEEIWNDNICPVLLVEAFDLSVFSRSYTSVFEQADPFPHRRRWGTHLSGEFWLNP